jgi:hypothetical protein
VVDRASSGMAGRDFRRGFPLAEAVQNRAIMLRGIGNAIVPQVAAAFIRAFLDTETG